MPQHSSAANFDAVQNDREFLVGWKLTRYEDTQTVNRYVHGRSGSRMGVTFRIGPVDFDGSLERAPLTFTNLKLALTDILHSLCTPPAEYLPGNPSDDLWSAERYFLSAGAWRERAAARGLVPKSGLESYSFRSDIEKVSERRKDPRSPYIARTQIAWDTPNGEMSISGMVEDKSKSGLGIEVSRSIPVGTSVRIRLGKEMISAVVRRCFKTDFGSFVGVSFERPAAQTEATELRGSKSA